MEPDLTAKHDGASRKSVVRHTAAGKRHSSSVEPVGEPKRKRPVDNIDASSTEVPHCSGVNPQDSECTEDDEWALPENILNDGQEVGFKCSVNGCSSVVMRKINAKRHEHDYHGIRLPSGKYARFRIRCSICSTVCLNKSNFGTHHKLKHIGEAKKPSGFRQYSTDRINWREFDFFLKTAIIL